MTNSLSLLRRPSTEQQQLKKIHVERSVSKPGNPSTGNSSWLNRTIILLDRTEPVRPMRCLLQRVSFWVASESCPTNHRPVEKPPLINERKKSAKMRAFYLGKRIIEEITRPSRKFAPFTTSLLRRTLMTVSCRPLNNIPGSVDDSLGRSNPNSPWGMMQYRGYKIFGSDLRAGNVIERKGRIYQVIKVQHTQQGRGGATIQAELRDIESGSKTNQKLRTDETLEGILVEDKKMTCLYTENDSVYLMDPKDFEQIEVNKELFGKNAVYLKDEMTITLQFYDGKPMSASVPKQVTCTVVQAQDPAKGLTATPQYKKVLLDNGLTMQVPEFIVTGDRIVISTTHDEYLTRAKD